MEGTIYLKHRFKGLKKMPVLIRGRVGSGIYKRIQISAKMPQGRAEKSLTILPHTSLFIVGKTASREA